jgi:hypothetical protein
MSLRAFVTPEEVFAINEKIRWMALTTDRGEVLYCQMRPGVQSYSPPLADEEFVKLGPLTMLGCAERYSEHLEGVECINVLFGLVATIYSRLGGQVISISIEREAEAIAQYLTWLAIKKSELEKK